MGMDMVASWFFTAKPELSIEAARAVVATLSDEELSGFCETAYGQTLANVEEADDPDDQQYRITERAEAIDGLLATLDLLVDFEMSRGGAQVIACPGGYTMWWAGGDSWGDDPNEQFTAVNNLLSVPRVMRALGATGYDGDDA